MQAMMQNNSSPIELIIELGVVGVSLINHRPKELSYFYFESLHIIFNWYDGGTTSRFKLILGHIQLDNQLPLTLMPMLLAPDANLGMHPMFKMNITMHYLNTDGIQVLPPCVHTGNADM